MTTDSDGDGTADPCDLCPGSNDDLDADSDGVPDGCDICAAGDDKADSDGDGVPDACDTCAAGDDKADADKDGVADACDVCDKGADALDADTDGVPDACDVCPNSDPDDANADRVCDDQAAFDLATISAFTFGTNIAAISSFTRIVNTGTEPLDLSTVQLVSVTDDHPVTVINATLGAPALMVPVGQAAGSLSTLASDKIVSSGVMDEPLATSGSSFTSSFSFQNVQAGTVHLKLVVSVGGSLATLNYVFRFQSGASNSFDSASRISSQRSF